MTRVSLRVKILNHFLLPCSEFKCPQSHRLSPKTWAVPTVTKLKTVLTAIAAAPVSPLAVAVILIL